MEKVKDKVKETLKGQDQFGYPISMNHNAETVHNTLPGGVTSVLMNAFLVWLSVT